MQISEGASIAVVQIGPVPTLRGSLVPSLGDIVLLFSQISVPTIFLPVRIHQ